MGFRSCADITHSVLCFEIYGVTLFCPIVTMITISLPQQNTNRTKIKKEFSGFVNFTFFSLFPYFGSKDDICFGHELGLAHVNFHRLNQQSSFYSLGRPE